MVIVRVLPAVTLNPAVESAHEQMILPPEMKITAFCTLKALAAEAEKMRAPAESWIALALDPVLTVIVGGVLICVIKPAEHAPVNCENVVSV